MPLTSVVMSPKGKHPEGKTIIGSTAGLSMLAKVRPQRGHGLYDRVISFWRPHRVVRVQPIKDGIGRCDGISVGLGFCMRKGATVLASHHLDHIVIANVEHLVAAHFKIRSAHGYKRSGIGRGVLRFGL